MKFFKKPEAWLVTIILIHLVVNIVWLNLDKTPPAWDQAAHIRSMALANQFFTGKFWGNSVDLMRAFGGYPPLIYWVGGLWSVIVGLSVAKVSFLNTIFLAVAIVGVYKLALELSKNKNTAVLAAGFFSLFPVIYDISRNMLLDLPLTAWVVWGIYFWLKSEALHKTKYAWGLWVMLVLSSLTKLNGFIYFGPIGLWLLWESRKSEKTFLRLVIGGLLYLPAVGWWWVWNWVNIYNYITGLAGQGEPLTDPMDLKQIVTWIHYIRLFFLQQAGPWVAIMVAVSAFKIPKVKENWKVIFWAAVTYVIFTIIKNKDFRFTMPILPVVAVWLGWGMAEFKKKWLVGALLVWLMINLVENSFNFPIKKPFVISTKTLVMGDVNWIDFSDYPVREVRTDVWPSETILTRIFEEPTEKVRILMGVNIERFNDNSLRTLGDIKWGSDFEKKVELVPVGGETPEFKSDEEIRILVGQFRQIIVPGKTLEPAPFYAVQLKAQRQLRDYLWAHEGDYPVKIEYKIPGGESVFLFSKD